MTEYITDSYLIHSGVKFNFPGSKGATIYIQGLRSWMGSGKAFYRPSPGVVLDGKWGLPIGQFFDMEREYERAVGDGQIDPLEMQEWQEVTYTQTRKLRGASTSAKSTTVSPSPWLPSWKRPHGSDSSPDTSNAG